MRQRDSKSNSPLLNGCGCLCLVIFMMVSTWIAMPPFLNMAYKAKRSEAKQYVSSMNKGQQAYFAENSAFTNSVDALGLGLKTETPNYKYSTRATKKAAFNYGVSKQKTEKSYVGAVFLVPAKDGRYTTSILCEADDRATIEPAEPTYQNGKLICGKGTTQVTK